MKTIVWGWNCGFIVQTHTWTQPPLLRLLVRVIFLNRDHYIGLFEMHTHTMLYCLIFRNNLIPTLMVHVYLCIRTHFKYLPHGICCMWCIQLWYGCQKYYRAFCMHFNLYLRNSTMKLHESLYAEFKVRFYWNIENCIAISCKTDCYQY